MENYKNKSKNELIKEIESLERNINDLEKNKLKFRQAEEALRKSEVKYRLLADNSTDAIWQTDLKLIFTYVSPSIKKIFGYSVEEWVGSGLSNHASRKEFLKIAREALKAIKNYKKFKYITFESVMRKKDGTEIPVEITGKLLLNKKGLPVGLQGTTRDITKRLSAEQEGKQAEEALRKSEKQMHTLINTMPDFVCLKDGDGRWLKTNDAGIRIFQLEGIEYQGKNDSELAELNSKLQGAFLTCKESDARVRKEGGLIHGEEIIPYPDGSVRVFDVVKVSVSQTDDKQKGLVILGHDITERKHTEEELKKYREHLEELVKERTLEVEEKAKKIKESQKAMRYLLEDVNEAREELVESNIKIKETNKDLESFAYSVSHDLKSPLRAINGYTKVLLEDYPGLFTDEKKEFMDLIISVYKKTYN